MINLNPSEWDHCELVIKVVGCVDGIDPRPIYSEEKKKIVANRSSLSTVGVAVVACSW